MVWYRDSTLYYSHNDIHSCGPKNNLILIINYPYLSLFSWVDFNVPKLKTFVGHSVMQAEQPTH